MRILEERHPNEPYLLWKIGNWTTVPIEWVRSWGVALGWEWMGVFQFGPFTTSGTGFKYFSHDALFWNALFFVRFVWPLGVFIQLRWSGETDRRAYVQFGFGWKLNGRLAFIFRIQSDDSAKVGAWSGGADENFSMNHGVGWKLGHK